MGFSMFWGPTPWVYLGESFPLRVRPKAIALGSATSTCIVVETWFPADQSCNRLDLELPAVLLRPSYRRGHWPFDPAHLLRHADLRLCLRLVSTQLPFALLCSHELTGL